VADSKSRLTPELLARLLVDNGHLTKFQATKLIAELKDTLSLPRESDSDARDDEDELGLAESDELAEQSVPSKPIEAKSGKSRRKSNTANVIIDETPLAAAEVVRSKPIDAARVPVVEVVEVDSPADMPTVGAADDFSESPRLSPKLLRPARPKSNPWDSFRILGVGLILSLVLVAGTVLVYYFWRGNAEERLKRADDAYEQRSYETAAVMYREFAEVFPSNEKASYARVRSALASIRKDVEGTPNPTIGLKAASEMLPGLVDETSLSEQQSDLAGVLIALAGKFNERADQASTTEERKDLMTEMAGLMELINDPRFVGANQRSQQAPTLNRIQEDRQRILREINRDEELVVALNEFDRQLEAKDTLKAYEIRNQLINRYPVLEANESLSERVQRATRVQQSLVESGSLQVEVSRQSPHPSDNGRSFVLANRMGREAPAMAGQVVFVKAKGAVYGIDGQTGNLLWRNFVGSQFHSYPLKLGETSTSDALMSEPDLGRISRVEGKSGETVWHADLNTAIHPPVAESEELFMATLEGSVLCLDAIAGQAKWTTKLPQPVQVAPCVAFGKPHLYLPAEHSNLYVISRVDGSCREVFYLGHRSGAIAVPPILLLGQLFVFENINSKTAKIRILSTSGEGLELKDAQVPLTMEGNIVVSPQVDGRRLIVHSDLGQIVILDIEPTADTQKVNEIASIPKNLFQPQLSWSLAENNRVWMADTRFTRFDLQVALQKLSRVWSKNDGDRFVGPPQKFGDVIVHTRTLRGNQGVRVSAVDANSGDAFWETDVGVPVTHVASAEGGQINAITSNAMMFTVDRQPITSSADVNPGQGKTEMRFDSSVQLTNGNVVLMNQSRANQLALYSPVRNALQLLSASFNGAAPSCEVVSVGDNLAIGLDNGQLVLIDPTNGSQVASPYQPPLEPGRKIRWNAPAYLASTQTLIVSSDLQKLVRLSVGDSLRPLGEVTLESPLVGPIVAVGNGVCAVETTTAGDNLKFFDATSLKSEAGRSLNGRAIFGPLATADGCIVQTQTHLVAFSSDGKQVWAIDYPNIRLLAPPSQTSQGLLFINRSGDVWLIDPRDGAILGKTSAGQSLSSAPVVLGAGLIIGSAEGGVLALPMPTANSEAR
jgi:outer membrane protein assembly factor BamB